MNELLEWSAENTGWVATMTDNVIIWFTLKIIIWVWVFILLFLISKIISRVIKKKIQKHMEETNPTWAKKIWSLLWNIVFYVLILLCVFISFEIMWLDIGLIVSWVSLWVWLAFKEILWNMFAWMMILYTKEFKMWDIIEVQSDQTYFGRIEEITIRYTIIRTLDLREVVIPNMTMISKPIKTFSSESIVKLNTTLWVHYDTDIEKAISVAKEAINSFDFVKEKENTTVFVTEFWSSSINLRCVFCFDTQCWIIWDFAIWYVNEKLREEFNKNWIQFTYDHIIIDMDDSQKNNNQTLTQWQSYSDIQNTWNTNNETYREQYNEFNNETYKNDTLNNKQAV